MKPEPAMSKLRSREFWESNRGIALAAFATSILWIAIIILASNQV